jgi:hypothetical protein
MFPTITTCTGCKHFDVFLPADEDDPAMGECTWAPKGGFPPSFKYALREVVSMSGDDEHNCQQKEVNDEPSVK